MGILSFLRICEDKTRKDLLAKICIAKNKIFSLSLNGDEKHVLKAYLLNEN